jgi:murein DD-endopeptidase MepM/ murein hydrolase activator NlpD
MSAARRKTDPKPDNRKARTPRNPVGVKPAELLLPPTPEGGVGDVQCWLWTNAAITPSPVKTKAKNPPPQFLTFDVADSSPLADFARQTAASNRLKAKKKGALGAVPSLIQVPGLMSVQFAETAEEQMIMGQMTFVDPNRTAFTLLPPGAQISIFYQYDTGANQPPRMEWLRVWVWDRSLTDAQRGTTTVGFVDLAAQLHRRGEEDRVFKKDNVYKAGWTASQIAGAISKAHNVPIVADTTYYKIPFLELRGISPYEMLLKAFEVDTRQTGIRYRVSARNGVITIQRRTVNEKAITIKRKGKNVAVLTPSQVENTLQAEASKRRVVEGRNLKSVDFSDSLEGKKTVVIVRANTGITGRGTEEATYKMESVIVQSSEAKDYGRLTKTLDLTQTGRMMNKTQLKNVAANHLAQLQRMARSATISADGNPLVRAGDAVYIEDFQTGLVGRFYVERVDHTVEGRRHEMNMEITEVVKTPKVTVGKDEVRTWSADTPAATDPSDPTTTTTSAAPTSIKGIPFSNPFGAENYSVLDTPAGHAGRRGANTIAYPLQDGFFGGWPSGQGYDLVAPVGTPIYAPIAGTVVYSFNRTKLGRANTVGYGVVIMSDNKRVAAFITHLDTGGAHPAKGSKVSRGDKIGTLGANFTTTQNHIHFSVGSGTNWSQGGAFNEDLTRALNASKGKPVSVTRTTNPTTGPGLPRNAEAADKIRAFMSRPALWASSGESYNSPPSPLLTKVDYIVKRCEENDIDPYFLVAIATNESRLGTYRRTAAKKNPFGLMDPATGSREVLNCPSWEYAIDWVTRKTMPPKRNAGLKTIGQLATVYAPVGAGNDPNGLNAGWPAAVCKFASAISGRSYSSGTQVLF